MAQVKLQPVAVTFPTREPFWMTLLILHDCFCFANICLIGLRCAVACFFDSFAYIHSKFDIRWSQSLRACALVCVCLISCKLYCHELGSVAVKLEAMSMLLFKTILAIQKTLAMRPCSPSVGSRSFGTQSNRLWSNADPSWATLFKWETIPNHSWHMAIST